MSPASDSYCQVYQPVITEKGDGDIKAARRVKNRLAANEKSHRCLCVDASNKICRK